MALALTLPTPNGDENVWGGLLNAYLTGLNQGKADQTVVDQLQTSVSSSLSQRVTNTVFAQYQADQAVAVAALVPKSDYDTYRAQVSASLQGKAAVDHVHDATGITTGLVDPARLGLGGINQLPVRNSSGALSPIAMSSNSSASTLALRTAAGALVVATPTDATHATTKAYVDTSFLGKTEALGSYSSFNARLAAISADGPYVSVPAYNINLETTSKLRNALGRVRAKTGNAKILEIGDSTSWGLGAGGADGFPPLKVMSDDFQRSFIDTSYGYIGIEGDNAPVTGDQVDARTSHKGVAGWNYTGYGFFASLQHGGTGTSEPWYLYPDINCDTFEMFYMKNNGLGTVDIYVDNVLATSVVTSQSPQGWAKATVSFAAGTTHVIKLIKRVNTVFLFGFNFYLSTRPSVQMFNAGVCGSKAYHPTGSSWGISGAATTLDGIPFIAPDLTIIRLGINDANAVPYSSVEDWEASLRRLITAAKITGDVLLESPIPSDPALNSGATVAREQAYRERLQAIAIETGCMYYDVFGRYGSWTVANAAGYMADPLHLTAAGGADLAAGRGKALLSSLPAGEKVTTTSNIRLWNTTTRTWPEVGSSTEPVMFISTNDKTAPAPTGARVEFDVWIPHVDSTVA